ncbi:STAS domain-containing protein [Streptomyces sp. NPDC060194]|uniref:STAS domain-containing protein n=1 Tax=Streptomyces sp. NPDC060194 TaxID=3347069 RepID=UPI00365FB78F
MTASEIPRIPERLFVLPGPRLTRQDVPALCERLASHLRSAGHPAEVTCDATAVTHADLAAVEAITRLRLTAVREGARVTFRNIGPDLTALLTLTGLGP